MFGIISIVRAAFDVMIGLVFVRCLLSFIKHDPYQPVFRFIYEVTEPIMGPFRRLIPAVGGIDFSPMVAVFVLYLIEDLVIAILHMLV